MRIQSRRSRGKQTLYAIPIWTPSIPSRHSPTRPRYFSKAPSSTTRPGRCGVSDLKHHHVAISLLPEQHSLEYAGKEEPDLRPVALSYHWYSFQLQALLHSWCIHHHRPYISRLPFHVAANGSLWQHHPRVMAPILLNRHSRCTFLYLLIPYVLEVSRKLLHSRYLGSKAEHLFRQPRFDSWCEEELSRAEDIHQEKERSTRRIIFIIRVIFVATFCRMRHGC